MAAPRFNIGMVVSTFLSALAQYVDDIQTGIVARGRRETSKTFTGAEVGVIRIDGIPLKAAKLYQIYTSSLRMALTSGETGIVQARIDVTGAAATTSSTIIGAWEGGHTSAFTPVNSPVLVAEYVPVSDVTLSVLLTLSRTGGANNITLSGSATQPICLYVKTLGFDPGDTGVDI